MSSSFFNQTTISKIKTVHKVFLWVATGIMIASLLLGAILIFVDTNNDLFGKIQGTFFIVAAAAFVCVNNFIRIEKGNKVVQGFALTGFAANLVWLVLGILMIWGVLSPVQVETSTVSANNAPTRTYELYDEYDASDSDAVENTDIYDDYDYYYTDDYDDYYDSDYYKNLEMDDVYYDVSNPTSYTPTTYNITVGARILIVTVSIAVIGFWVSNVLVIKDRMKAVKPLKIVAIICEIYGSVFVIVMALAWPISIDQNLLKWAQLAGLTSSGFIVTALAAWIISRTHKDFDTNTAEGQPQLAEQVLTVEAVEPVEPVEPIADEVKVEEKVKEEIKEDLPPLQSDDMPPSVNHDNDMEVNESNPSE